VTLAAELRKNKEIEAIGGIAYLASLTENLPRRPKIDDYLRIIADKSIARKIMVISSAIIARAADQSESASQTLDVLEAQLVQLKDRSKLLSRRRNPEPFFVGFRTFIDSYSDTTEWTVEGLIQKEGNGLIIGDSGTSKSLLVFDLALHLVGGVAWFHHRIPQRIKVGLVSREDHPGLSHHRLKRLREGAPESLAMFLEGIDLEDWLYVHTRAQRETWTLQKETDIQEIIESIKERGIQICFFDVFRVLWDGNENDNKETAKVLESAKRIGRESNCQVCIVHHLSKSDRGTIFDRARGGGISGWKEWGMALTIENQDADPKDLIRKIQFHTKAACANDPIYYRIDGQDTRLSLYEVEGPSQSYSPRRDRQEKKEPAPQTKMPYND
jgi:RecA-family ATPase